MKKILVLLLGILFLGITLNCSSVPEKNPSLQREWMMVSFGNFSKEMMVKNKAGINLTSKIEDGKIKGGAFMGCNKMFFTAEIKSKGKIKFSGLGSTMMACQDMKLEEAFSRSIEKITHYSVEGHFLTLSDDKGEVMKFVASDWD
ncbi:META domain-containing protein [Chryseobacterium sp. ISL-6]|uniref:META domain-containing protein n=1 Tax=Chryseobacterium sp. ISL-6 TaxID=2819143 RepID=UPI001BEC6A80|nr:META domain-containing protein [Chryseobacterium sp. ISL-6]MBT2621592.1 META domain-containing protein [Chryseobacterium sp. ISL-6]